MYHIVNVFEILTKLMLCSRRELVQLRSSSSSLLYSSSSFSTSVLRDPFFFFLFVLFYELIRSSKSAFFFFFFVCLFQRKCLSCGESNALCGRHSPFVTQRRPSPESEGKKTLAVTATNCFSPRRKAHSEGLKKKKKKRERESRTLRNSG